MRRELTAEMIAKADPDAGGPSEFTSHLRDELLHLDSDAVYSASSGEAQNAGKGTRPLTTAGLMAQFAPPQDTLPSVSHGAQSWLAHQHAHTVKRTLHSDSARVTDAIPAQRDRLIELRVKRHARAG